jgi:hypothetical protein
MNETKASTPARLLHRSITEVFAMAQPLRRDAFAPESPRVPAAALSDSAVRHAFQILYFGFIVAPIVAGIDKFFHFLVNWDQYLAPTIAGFLPIDPHTFMLAVGVIEVVAGILVAVKPSIGGLVVAAWLWGIIVNLLLIPGYFDIALRDFGLSLGALALARLGHHLGR